VGVPAGTALGQVVEQAGDAEASPDPKLARLIRGLGESVKAANRASLNQNQMHDEKCRFKRDKFYPVRANCNKLNAFKKGRTCTASLEVIYCIWLLHRL